jgi:hypothetical protein
MKGVNESATGSISPTVLEAICANSGALIGDR